MAFKLLVAKNRKLATQLMLHGIYRRTSDADLRTDLRLTLACLIAKHFEHDPSTVLDIAMMETMIDRGSCGFTDCAWVCSYIGFERVTSKWAKDQGLHCVICARFSKGNRFNFFELEHHTVQFYF